jgi:hypothetical protein
MTARRRGISRGTARQRCEQDAHRLIPFLPTEHTSQRKPVRWKAHLHLKMRFMQVHSLLCARTLTTSRNQPMKTIRRKPRCSENQCHPASLRHSLVSTDSPLPFIPHQKNHIFYLLQTYLYLPGSQNGSQRSGYQYHGVLLPSQLHGVALPSLPSHRGQHSWPHPRE